MLDLLLLATMTIVCGGIGLPLTRLVPARFRWRALTAPTLGLSVLAVLVPVLYRFGVPMLAFFIGACVLATVILALHARRAMRAASALSRPNRRLALILVASWFATTLLLLAPRWIGGDQFSVFQGNHWDTYAYLESAMVYARKPHATVAAADDEALLRDPMHVLARDNLVARPSVHMLYAAFSRVAPGQAYRLYYPFLVFFFAQFVAVAVCFLRTALPNARPVAWIAPAVVFPLGFWGQYVFDINAWSQISAIPVLFLLFGLVVHAAAIRDESSGFRSAGAIAVVVAGATYLYPEGLIIYVGALVPVGVAAPLWAMIRRRQFSIRPFAPLLGMFGVATGFLYPPAIEFVVRQLTFASSVKVPWWQFFQIFFLGRDGVAGGGADRVVDFVAGFVGLYFVTPGAETGDVVSALQRIAIVVVTLAIVVSLGALISGRVRLRDELSDDSRSIVRLWVVVTIVMLGPAALLALRESYWAAGKAVSFAAPVFVTLFCVPIAFGFARPVLRPVRWIAAVYVVAQIGAGFVRVPAAASQDGIHYAPPYPSINNAGLKQDFGWDASGLEELLTRQTRVLITTWDPFVDSHLMVFLYSRKIPFAKVVPVNTYLGATGREVGSMPLRWEPDVELKADRDAYIVTFKSDGHSVRVPAR